MPPRAPLASVNRRCAPPSVRSDTCRAQSNSIVRSPSSPGRSGVLQLLQKFLQCELGLPEKSWHHAAQEKSPKALMLKGFLNFAGRRWTTREGGVGGDEEDRTPDLRIANATLSQLSYAPIKRKSLASNRGPGASRPATAPQSPVANSPARAGLQVRMTLCMCAGPTRPHARGYKAALATLRLDHDRCAPPPH